MRWDIFCRVIDNHGDAGVCWRLCAELAARGEAVRLWIDDPAPLAWMAPGGQASVEVIAWRQPIANHAPGDVVVEAFGCDPHEAFLEAMATRVRAGQAQPAWFNLEYLSAESWVERCHGLPSPVQSGPARGLTKRFLFPGFTPATGGLVREQDLDRRQEAFDPIAWRRARGLPAGGERLVSLFCYEPAALPALIARLGASAQPTRLLVTEGRARQAVEAALHQVGTAPRPTLTWLPLMPQPKFDELLWACDLNFVRGEDSLVRALWSGRPFIWQIYPQDDGAHHPKLRAFLDWLQAPADLRAFHGTWNAKAPHDVLPDLNLASWQACTRDARERLRSGPDLVDRLMAAAAQARSHLPLL